MMCPCKQMNGNKLYAFFNVTERVFWACSLFVYLNVFDHTGRKTGSKRAIKIGPQPTEYVFKSSSLFYHNHFQILTLGYFDTYQ